jgi:5-methylcytosine-specific restriction endonuclease McrA
VVPLSTLSWQESIKQIFTDAADMLAEYEDWQVHSPSITMTVPSVIMLRQYVRVNRGVKFSRSNVLLRDSHECQYCGINHVNDRNLLTLDHVVPRFHGGKTRWDNVVAACSSCNLEKAHFMKMKPRYGMPKRPGYYELVAKAMKAPIVIPHESWKDFLGWDESLIILRNEKN